MMVKRIMLAVIASASLFHIVINLQTPL